MTRSNKPTPMPYGGAVIQDLGYYPFGSREFSDFVHYVRSGDFVREVLFQSHDVNEYASSSQSMRAALAANTASSPCSWQK
jgi:hypothetical protein